MDKKNSLIFTLTKSMIIFLFIYYFIIMLIGSILSILIACNMNSANENHLLIKTFIASISVSGMLCSIQYIHRLYKACINKKIKIENDFLKSIGNFMYFIFRPLFSFIFVIVMIFSLLSGMYVVTGEMDNIVNDKFLYLCVILSSFIGFSIGKVLDKFQNISDKKIENYNGYKE